MIYRQIQTDERPSRLRVWSGRGIRRRRRRVLDGQEERAISFFSPLINDFGNWWGVLEWMIKGRITALWNVQPKLLLFVYESFGALCRYFTYVQFRSLTEWVAAGWSVFGGREGWSKALWARKLWKFLSFSNNKNLMATYISHDYYEGRWVGEMERQERVELLNLFCCFFCPRKSIENRCCFHQTISLNFQTQMGRSIKKAEHC